MQERKKLPIGIESFEKIRQEDFYYVDKSGLIIELLKSWGEVNLFTRPRRFGKSLNMNMLKYFFEYGCDSRLFDGLAIAGEKALCEKYMGRFPVIFVSFKDIGARGYAGARAAMCSVISHEARRFPFLAESDRLQVEEKVQYARLCRLDLAGMQERVLAEEELRNSLLVLSRLLFRHYGQKTMILIDEYDVPLDQAHRCGYYDEMADLMRNLFSRALKSNESLCFAILTGCLRIAKESIFTGLNNFYVLSIADAACAAHFGFSDGEVREMLEYYGVSEKYDLVKEWYDGYHFGNMDVYCPWDVINYVNLLRSDPHASPRAFWVNSSGNDIIRIFLGMADAGIRRDLEELIAGSSVVKRVRQELTYRELYDKAENIWSVLFTTGYLTCEGRADGDMLSLVIPNREIRKIFIEQIQEWFRDEMERDTKGLDDFCDAFENGDAALLEQRFNAWLRKTISIRDADVRTSQRENFYHGLLLGLLSHRGDWIIRSNAESGEGYSDILVEIEEKGIGIVVELKYVDGGSLDAGCDEALRQIEEKEYESRLLADGMETILAYGIACRRKRCRVKSAPCISSGM